MLSGEDQELIEQIISIKCPDATTILDLDADGIDIQTARLRRPFEVIICTGPSFTRITCDDDLRGAFRTFTAHARNDTVLIVKRPEAFHQAQLETRARSYRFLFYTCFGAHGQLKVFGFGSQMIDAVDGDSF